MIIDCHTHINNYHTDKVVSLEACLNDLTDTMAENNVDYSLILTSYMVNENRPGIKKVVEAVRDRKNLGVVAGISYLGYKERDLRELSDYLEAGLIKA